MSTSGGGGSGAMPAWKLRMMQQQQQRGGGVGAMPASNTMIADQAIPKNSIASSCSSQDPAEARAKLKKKMEAATLDPNLPPAFKVVMKGRLAFAKQQQRRKNNDTWVSLNSSHINAESSRPVDFVDPNNSDDDDSSFASMGEDSYDAEPHEDDDKAIIEEGNEEDDD